jgi:hypothetical protein
MDLLDYGTIEIWTVGEEATRTGAVYIGQFSLLKIGGVLMSDAPSRIS